MSREKMWIWTSKSLWDDTEELVHHCWMWPVQSATFKLYFKMFSCHRLLSFLLLFSDNKDTKIGKFYGDLWHHWQCSEHKIGCVGEKLLRNLSLPFCVSIYVHPSVVLKFHQRKERLTYGWNLNQIFLAMCYTWGCCLQKVLLYICGIITPEFLPLFLFHLHHIIANFLLMLEITDTTVLAMNSATVCVYRG